MKKAVVLPMKRAPKGARGNISRTTYLSFDHGSLLIEAPMHTTALISDSTFQAKVIVDAVQLTLTLEKMPKAECIELAIDRENRKLIMKVAALKVALNCKILS